MTTQNDESSIIQDRAREMLDVTSDSVRAELERAEGWLRSGRVPNEPDRWRIESAAGAVGSLADAWGRLVLWSRANGTFDTVSGDLEDSMKMLVQARTHLVAGTASREQNQFLEEALARIQAIHQTVAEATLHD